MLKLRDIMTRDVITVAPELSLRDTMDLLATRHIGGVPVVSGSRVVGVITATDLLAFASSLENDPDATREDAAPLRIDEDRDTESWSWDDNAGPAATYFTGSWDQGGSDAPIRFDALPHRIVSVLDDHTVADAMTPTTCSLPSGASVVEAAEYMRRSAIHRLLVIDDGQLMGIVSTMDITKAVADHRLVARTYVFRDPATAESPERHHTQLGARLPIAH